MLRLRPARAHALAALLALVLTPTAAARGERVIVGLEGAALVPLTSPRFDRLYPGATFSVATQFSVTNYLMPLLRVRSGFFPSQPQLDLAPEHLVAVMGGIRFRPRGIAHPEEPSRASCVWAEVDAGLAISAGRYRPGFEAAIGFGFVVDDVTMGPVVRFVHVLSTEASDGPESFSLSVGLEVLLHDAR